MQQKGESLEDTYQSQLKKGIDLDVKFKSVKEDEKEQTPQNFVLSLLKTCIIMDIPRATSTLRRITNALKYKRFSQPVTARPGQKRKK